MNDQFNQEVFRFLNEQDKTNWLEEWGLPDKEQYVYAELWLKSKAPTPMYADLIGYKDRYGVVLETSDKRIVTVHPAYLKEMQSYKVIEPIIVSDVLPEDEDGQLSLF